ncbi:MAG: 50S ribosomal protein L22 [Candidatus Spechtbacterales bacterium]
MEINAKLRYLRMSPRKMRLVADLVRGLGTDNAKRALKFSDKKAAGHILTLLNSAIANASNNFQKKEALYIKKIFVDQGPTYKRFRPVSRGMAHPINKRTSHVTIILDETKNES